MDTRKEANNQDDNLKKTPPHNTYSELVWAGMKGDNATFRALLLLLAPNKNSPFLINSLEHNPTACALLVRDTTFSQADKTYNMACEDDVVFEYLELEKEQPSWQDYIDKRACLFDQRIILGKEKPLSEQEFNYRKQLKNWITFRETCLLKTDIDSLLYWILNECPQAETTYVFFCNMAQVLQKKGYATGNYYLITKEKFETALQKKEAVMNDHIQKWASRFFRSEAPKNIGLSTAAPDLDPSHSAS